MSAAAHPSVMAGAALAAASLVAVTPIAPRPLQLPILSTETRLVDAATEAVDSLVSGASLSLPDLSTLATDSSATDSILNVPINLLYDILNIPYNEVQQLDTFAGSLFFAGTWDVPSATNLWGIDPGDPTHVADTVGFIPFPALTEGYGGLEYQLDGLLAAELPVSASCDATTCAPTLPPNDITGITGLDRLIGFFESLTGQQLWQDFFKVPLSTLVSGYTFNQADDPGVIDPSGPTYVNPAFGFPQTGGGTLNPFEGATTPITLPDGTTENAMPWDGLTFHLNLLQPFENFFNSLLAPPSTDGIAGATGIAIPGTGIEIPTFKDIFQALQADLAGLVVAFYPTKGGGCPGECINPAWGTVPQVVQLLDPNHSNPMIQAWLAGLTSAPLDNEPTPTQIQIAVDLSQEGFFDQTPAQLDQTLAELDKINPELGQLAVNAGILTDPGYLPPDGSGTAELGGFAPNLILSDLWNMLVGSDVHSPIVDSASQLMGDVAPQTLADTGAMVASSLFGL